MSSIACRVRAVRTLVSGRPVKRFVVFRSAFSALHVVLLSSLLAACGSSQAEPKAPEEAGSQKSEVQEATPTEEKDGEEGESADSSSESAEPSGPSLSRSVQDIISEPGNAWVFNFQSSEPYEKAQEKCDARFKDKPQERAKCISQARSSFVADAMEFKKDASGQDVWVVYKAQGSRLIQIYSIPIRYGEEKAGVLEVSKAGKGKGTPPMFASASKFEVKLLSNYTMELNDDRHGRLTYDARIGYISKSQ